MVVGAVVLLPVPLCHEGELSLICCHNFSNAFLCFSCSIGRGTWDVFILSVFYTKWWWYVPLVWKGEQGHNSTYTICTKSDFRKTYSSLWRHLCLEYWPNNLKMIITIKKSQTNNNFQEKKNNATHRARWAVSPHGHPLPLLILYQGGKK